MDTQEISSPEQQPSKKDQIAKIIDGLSREFPPQPLLTTGEVNRHTNDTNLEVVWRNVSQLLPEVSRRHDDHIRVGLLVGSGGVPSILPELLLNTDVLLFTDYDQRALEWVKFTLEQLEKRKNIDGYESKVYSSKNPLLQSTGANRGAVSYIDEATSLGEFHLLDSEERYNQVRSALLGAKVQGKQFGFVPLDLRDVEQGKKLKGVLGDNADIVYANVTNVAFHVITNAINTAGAFSLENATHGYRDTLSALPFDQDAVIQYSLIPNRRELPKAHVTQGLENYFQQSFVMPPV